MDGPRATVALNHEMRGDRFLLKLAKLSFHDASLPLIPGGGRNCRILPILIEENEAQVIPSLA